MCSILTDFGVEKDAWSTPGFAGHESGDVEQGVDDLDPANLDANLLFRFNMPLPDADHSLHHATCQSLISPFFVQGQGQSQRHCSTNICVNFTQVMNTIQEFFMWDDFETTLNCISRWFSIRARCDRFIAECIMKNQSIQD